MNRHFSPLSLALGISLAMHLLPVLPELISPRAAESTAKPPPLLAELRPAQPAAAIPPLKLPDPAPVEPSIKPEKKKTPPPPVAASTKGKPVPTWTQAVRQHLKKLDAAGQFYPQEAIARGWQGDVDVLMVLDESGKVVAARIERGSGYSILDDAALHAVRSLNSLPADAPRQVVLPVHFRLH